MPLFSQMWAPSGALLATAAVSMMWYNLVEKHVPDPYLDEVFHVPQVQRYCNKDYTWDPKITTPPGLYLVSLLIKGVVGCDTPNLRALNIGAICLICLVSYHLLSSLHKNASPKEARRNGTKGHWSLLDAHTALNISLFPPLFFFSALYYTDVMSTLVVLVCYSILGKRKDTTSPFVDNLESLVVGVFALLFRQTNIFWVAVFPAAIVVVEAVKAKQGQSSGRYDAKTVLERSWSHGEVYDCSVEAAGPQDFVLFFITLALAVIRQPLLVFKTVITYLILIAVFAGFVAWNGSVVLGDKSAHTATLHLPQMLYFWPYIVFFSLPLAVGPILAPFVQLLPSRPRTLLENSLTGKSKMVVPGFVAAIIVIPPGLAAVHFNTIVHPYTLADNRHYVFYIFRILRRHWAIKYAAVPLYYTCAWMTLQTLSNKTQTDVQPPPKQTHVHSTSKQSNELPNCVQTSSQSCQISFVVAWVATTTLSVATAPLVEPRYFIIPFIIWRLHVPYLPRAQAFGENKKGSSYDWRLVLETVWLLVVNMVVGYMFLHRGFSWPQEPGKVQRFLW